MTFTDDRGLEDRAIARQNHTNEYTLNALQVTKEVFAGVRAIDFYVRAEAVKQKRRHCGKSKKRGKNHHLFARMRIRIHLDDDETRNNNNVLEDV